MKEKFSKLVNVKSIVTILLSIVFSFLAIRGDISGQEFIGIFTMIIAFYFGTQSEKKSKEGD